MVTFNDAPKRTKIDRSGLVDIYVRQFGGTGEGITKPELERQIKKFGRCECSKTCKEPLAGSCDFDHRYPNSLSVVGATIDWRALLPAHHKEKTTKRDIPHIAKVKRNALKYNPDYAEGRENREKRKSKFQSQGFYKHPTKKRTVGGKVVDR